MLSETLRPVLFSPALKLICKEMAQLMVTVMHLIHVFIIINSNNIMVCCCILDDGQDKLLGHRLISSQWRHKRPTSDRRRLHYIAGCFNISFIAFYGHDPCTHALTIFESRDSLISCYKTVFCVNVLCDFALDWDQVSTKYGTSSLSTYFPVFVLIGRVETVYR